jgi:hypothetical protein
MPGFWGGSGSGPTPVTAFDWFGKQFLRARALVPAADFDTVIGEDFAETITSELVDVTGASDASPLASTVRAGVVELTAASNVSDGTGALQLTGAGAHVQLQNAAAGGPWYMASLAKLIQPGDNANAIADMIAISDDDNGQNFIALGLYGPGSGGSVTNWKGSAFVGGAAAFQLTGPALDNVESPVYHLFEVWNDGTAIHFAIDGTEFSTTQPSSAAAAAFGKLKCRAVAVTGQAVACDYDKWIVAVKSMTVGEP